MRMCLLIVGLGVIASWSLVHAGGYRTEGDRIVVEGEDWEAWEYPKGVLERNEDGWLKPRFVQKNINACLDAVQFGGGVKDAGSSIGDVAKVMDGSMETYWEPDKDAPIEDWWFEIDLGRCVSAIKIVLKFVREGRGDPFRDFAVEVFDGWKSTTGRSALSSYRRIGETIVPNEVERVFVFELSLPGTSGSGEFEGDLVRYIRVRIRDSKGDKREEVPREDYEALDLDWRGAREYFRITASGEEWLIPEEEYRELPSEERGQVKYYRREVPRLAELEVWSLGDNLSLGILDRGGSIDIFKTGTQSGAAFLGFDGDLGTAYDISLVDPLEPGWTLIDLGALFWVDRVRLVLMPSSFASMDGYKVLVSDGSKRAGGDFAWSTVTPEERWDKAEGVSRVIAVSAYVSPRVFYFEDTLNLMKARFLKFQLSFLKASRYIVWEFQVYGEGYVPELVFTSPIMEIGKSRNLTSIIWETDTPPGTSVEVQTRTGDTLGEEKHYFDAGGNEVTEFYWKRRLPGFARGPVKSEPIPGPDWSPWSRPYEQSGDPFQSPSPREYLQIRVKLLSDDPYQAPSLKSLSIPFTTPLTETISGTMSPRQVQRLGAPELFTLKIHPLLQQWHPGFNQLLIQTLDRMEVRMVKMEVRKDSTSTDLTDHVEILPTPPDSLWMVLPDTIQYEDAEEIELQFSSALYQDSTPFNVFVGHTSLPGVWQQVESEDFHPFLHTFIVFVPLDKKMIDNVEIVPSVLTPNGDGVHDVMTIHFTVGRIKAQRDVRVTIYDLRGRSVRHMVERREKYPLGKYAMEWDGRDDGGGLVAPGMYVVVIRVHSNWEEARNTEVKRRVVVAY